jgi:CDP-paratose 2-epimerase
MKKNQDRETEHISVTAPDVQKAGLQGDRQTGHILITGGAGFIGTNLAKRLLSEGEHVLVYDNLSRRGSEQNLLWLREHGGKSLQAEIADVCDQHSLRKTVKNAKQVFHLAAQVAVTSSLSDPVHDFESNLRGTLNLLEALRALDNPPPMVFTSTNKVYGPLTGLNLRKNSTRYESLNGFQSSISEDYPIMFHSPYGCSKGAADQYVSDYVRVFGLKAVVFRMSCIYGPHQFGTEDQGWVANFLIRAIEGKPITVFGDGMQVRDVLFVEDLVEAFLLAQEHMDRISGEVFNIGGGLRNSMSLIELLKYIEELLPGASAAGFEDWRTGDQRYYVTDYRKFKSVTGWVPRIGVRQGLGLLYEWLAATGNKSQTMHARRP